MIVFYILIILSYLVVGIMCYKFNEYQKKIYRIDTTNSNDVEIAKQYLVTIWLVSPISIFVILLYYFLEV